MRSLADYEAKLLQIEQEISDSQYSNSSLDLLNLIIKDLSMNKSAKAVILLKHARSLKSQIENYFADPFTSFPVINNNDHADTQSIQKLQTLQMQVQDVSELEMITHTDESLEQDEVKQLESDLQDIAHITKSLLGEVKSQEQKLVNVQENVEVTVEKIEKGVSSQKKAVIGATLGLAIGGTIVGGALGGPIGAVIGHSVAAAAVGTGVGVGAGVLGGVTLGKLREFVSGASTKLRRKDESQETKENMNVENE